MKNNKTKQPEAPHGLQQAFFLYLWPPNTYTKKIVLIVATIVGIGFAIWVTFPDETKKEIIDYLKKQLSETPAQVAKPTEEPAVSSQESSHHQSTGKKHEPSQPSAFEKSSELKASNPHALLIENGQLLIIDDDKGVAVIEIVFDNDCKATYKWRYSSVFMGKEETGSGKLIEQFLESTEQKDMSVSVRSETYIHAGQYKVEWSCINASSGSIYPRGLNAHVVKNIYFEDVEL